MYKQKGNVFLLATIQQDTVQFKRHLLLELIGVVVGRL